MLSMRRLGRVLAACMVAGGLASTTSCGGDAPPPSAPPTSTGGPKRDVHPNEIRGESTFAWRQPAADERPERGGTAVLALLSDIDSLNPFTSSSADASEVHDLIYPRLMNEQPDYYQGPPTFTPQIAESWTFGADGLSIRFKLRDCPWSDGTPMTADDVKFSWEAARNKDVAWVSASIVDFIRDIEIHSPREFTAHYSEKYPYQLMDINDVQVLPKHAFGKVPFQQWQTHGLWDEQAKVCGGPWQFQSYTPNQEIVLVRNPKYWDEGKPYLDKVIFRIVGDQRSEMSSLLSKGIDLVQGVPPKEARRVLDAGHLKLYTYVTRTFGYLGWSNIHWPFDDARVRRAMTYAIDRENIVESVFYGYAHVAAPAIISSLWASNKSIRPYPYDPAKAEALLQEAGFKRNASGVFEKDGRPFKFTLTVPSTSDVRKSIGELVQANLKKVGVLCEIELMDFNQMGTQLKQHNREAYSGAWSVATKVDNKPIWHSTSAEGRFNYVSFSHPRVDEIIDQARVMSDFKAAKPLWDEMQKILDDLQPYTMLYEPRGLVAVDARFRNVKVTSLRATDNLHEWWVPGGERRYK